VKKKMNKKKPQRQRVLAIICGLFLISGGLRIGSDAGQAIARETPVDTLAEAMPEPAVCEPPINEDLGGLVSAIRSRETALQDRENQIADRLQALAIAESEITIKLDELTIAEESLRATMALAAEAAESDLGRLTQVYENMKPAEAAALFEEMDPEFAAGFLARMRPEFAAAIMAGLEPSTAYAISASVAGRNDNVPSE
jgi:flagellar motility protein MotE (MotC chaperone)